MIQKVEHIGIMVTDLKKSIHFYEEVLGFELIGREKMNGDVELAFLALPGKPETQLELIAGTGETHPTRGVVNHVAFTVTDIEQEWKRLKEISVELIDEEPRTILGGIKIGFFYGPDNERLELFQPKA